MMLRLFGAAVLLAGALLGWRLHNAAPGEGTAQPLAPVTGIARAIPEAQPAATDEPVDGHADTQHPQATTVALPQRAAPPAQLDSDAIAALRATREQDPRAPAMGSDQRLREAASDAVRDNYSDYRGWQQQQRLAGYARYVAAANEKLARIDAHLQWGERNGVSEQDLAAGREKRARLAAARDSLVTDYPDLAVPATDSLAAVPMDDPDPGTAPPAGHPGTDSERQD